jgi:dTDP-4-amino-4,6-dideoxygalactose transaminase
MSVVRLNEVHRPIRFVDLAAQRGRIAELLQSGIDAVLEHGNFIFGPEVGRLEEQLSAFAEIKHAVTCANGTDALMLALRGHGIGAGHAVLLPSFTFAATASAVAHIGAVPVFLDVDEGSFNIDPSQIPAAAALARKHGLEPRCVIAVDLFGRPADYDEIQPYAEKEGLMLVIDAAQSFGARYKGRSNIAYGTIATTSFFPSKPLGCYGDGGAVFTNVDDIARLLKSLRCHGQGSNKYQNVRLGWNSRLDTIQAAILLAKLTVFPEELKLRNAVADRYHTLLGDHIEVPTIPASMYSSWAQYTLVLEGRDHIASYLGKHGIPTVVYYPEPLHCQEAFRSFPRLDDLSRSERLSRHVLSLPMHPYLDEQSQVHIAETILRAQSA